MCHVSVGHTARVFEERGIATTCVFIDAFSHYARQMKLPRVLVTPFPMGRPLGAPGDQVTQRSVVTAALRLVDDATGPETVSDFDGVYRPSYGAPT